jgi:hypothetical protein
VRSGPGKTAKKKKTKRKKKYSGQQQKEIDCDEPHPAPNEKTQPIQGTERPTGALVAVNSLWPGSRRSETGAIYQGEQMCVSATTSSSPQATTFSSSSSPTLRHSLSLLSWLALLLIRCLLQHHVTTEPSFHFRRVEVVSNFVSVQTRVDAVLSCCGVGTGESCCVVGRGESCCSISWCCVGKYILVEREGRGHMLPPKVDRGCVLTPFRELL